MRRQFEEEVREENVLDGRMKKRVAKRKEVATHSSREVRRRRKKKKSEKRDVNIDYSISSSPLPCNLHLKWKDPFFLIFLLLTPRDDLSRKSFLQERERERMKGREKEREERKKGVQQ